MPNTSAICPNNTPVGTANSLSMLQNGAIETAELLCDTLGSMTVWPTGRTRNVAIGAAAQDCAMLRRMAQETRCERMEKIFGKGPT